MSSLLASNAAFQGGVGGCSRARGGVELAATQTLFCAALSRGLRFFASYASTEASRPVARHMTLWRGKGINVPFLSEAPTEPPGWSSIYQPV